MAQDGNKSTNCLELGNKKFGYCWLFIIKLFWYTSLHILKKILSSHDLDKFFKVDSSGAVKVNLRWKR